MDTITSAFLSEKQFSEIFKSHIRIETYTRAIENIFSRRMLDRIDYKPYYQRNYVWDDVKASYFVESILLGTEIPPLVFFKEDRGIEVIDGRQRFETLKRFFEGDFKLAKKGLDSLIDLSKKDVNNLRQEQPDIYNMFLDAKIRMIEFELINQPPTNPILIDRLKKEIFSRYNSGITPLRKTEIDNANYNLDNISQYFKQRFRSNEKDKRLIFDLFLSPARTRNPYDVEAVLQFVRTSLVMFLIPIKYYARTSDRSDLIRRYYDYFYSKELEFEKVYTSFMQKVFLVERINQRISENVTNVNRLFREGLLWMIKVMEKEEKDFRCLEEERFVKALYKLLLDNIDAFNLTDSHYRKPTLDRFSVFETYMLNEFNLPISEYVQGSNESHKQLQQIKDTNKDTSIELKKLKTLRITKPDPSRISVDDLIRSMRRDRFLVRPTYQRSEVIDLTKASSIIESILLGIMIPAIFIFKREDGISEVIDGQQRILTILGFMGERYLDENSKSAYSKNNLFHLRKLKILEDLNGKTYKDLEHELREKILDFELLVVEIEERLNPEFSPVDLFIRLNNKPYPIRENSFEMWNSWVDKDIIASIKKICQEAQSWFFIKDVNKRRFGDRMNNEELFTILSYFDYQKSHNRPTESFLDIYQRQDRVNARVKEKKDVTSLLFNVTSNIDAKNQFLISISNIDLFLKKTEALLNLETTGVGNLKDKLDHLLSSRSRRQYLHRTFQDFYILWYILSEIDIDALKSPIIYKRIEDIFNFTKSVPDYLIDNNEGYTRFENLVKNLTSLKFEELIFRTN